MVCRSSGVGRNTDKGKSYTLTDETAPDLVLICVHVDRNDFVKNLLVNLDYVQLRDDRCSPPADRHESRRGFNLSEIKHLDVLRSQLAMIASCEFA